MVNMQIMDQMNSEDQTADDSSKADEKLSSNGDITSGKECNEIERIDMEINESEEMFENENDNEMENDDVIENDNEIENENENKNKNGIEEVKEPNNETEDDVDRSSEKDEKVTDETVNEPDKEPEPEPCSSSRLSDKSKEEDQDYDVEKIVDVRRKNGKVTHYKVRWKGFNPEDDTWERLSNINCPDLIDEYNAANPESDSDAGSVVYEVEKILAVRKKSDVPTHYKVRWKGFSARHDTWEHISNLNCDALLTEFNDRPDSTAKRTPSRSQKPTRVQEITKNTDIISRSRARAERASHRNSVNEEPKTKKKMKTKKGTKTKEETKSKEESKTRHATKTKQDTKTKSSSVPSSRLSRRSISSNKPEPKKETVKPGGGRGRKRGRGFSKQNSVTQKKQKIESESSSDDSDDGNGEYEVSSILEARYKQNGTREFLVRWKGYTPSDDTWEPDANLSCPELINEFISIVEKTNAKFSSTSKPKPPTKVNNAVKKKGRRRWSKI